MKKIETNIEDLLKDLQGFYNYKEWEFLTLNGVKIDENQTEIQYIFSKYFAKDEIVVFYMVIEDSVTLPSIVELIPSAIISQREIVDMFGIIIEDTTSGLYLDEDSIQKPLSTCGI